jgi:methylmalonyl-CoA/ethylmalonyl-CoA epimerase
VIRGIHHVGIAVQRLEEAYRLYRDVLGLPLIHEAEVPDQGVRAALLAAGDSEIELLEPLGASSGVARFLARQGEGLHHLCFDTSDVRAELDAVKEKGAELIDAAPRTGLAGRIAFLHPRACAGVLIELATPVETGGVRADATRGPGHRDPAGTAEAAASASPPASSSQEAPAGAPPGLRLKRLIIGADDPRETAAVFQRLFALPEVVMNGGPRVMLGVGRGALLIVPAAEVGGSHGMVAVSMLAENFPGLLAALERMKTPGVLRGTGEVTLEPVATHGVHLHISKYE